MASTILNPTSTDYILVEPMKEEEYAARTIVINKSALASRNIWKKQSLIH